MGSFRRHLARLIYLFDSFEAVEQLQGLVKVARSTLNDKADELAAVLDEVRDRQGLLPSVWPCESSIRLFWEILLEPNLTWNPLPF